MYGVSIDSQICLLIATLSRIVWFGDTRLTNLWYAYVELGIGVILHVGILAMSIKFKDELYKDLPIYLRWYVLFAISVVFSLIFYPGASDPSWYITKQMFVSLTMFIELLGLVAQLVHTNYSEAVDGV